MKHALSICRFMAATAVSTALAVGWVVFCANLAHGELWGLAVALSPFVLIPLGIALYKDLSK